MGLRERGRDYTYRYILRVYCSSQRSETNIPFPTMVNGWFNTELNPLGLGVHWGILGAQWAPIPVA